MKVNDSHKWKCFRFVFKDTFAGLSEHWPHPQVVLCVADLPLLGEGQEGISLQSCCHECIQTPTCHYSLSAAGIDWQCCRISKLLIWQTEEHLCIDIHSHIFSDTVRTDFLRGSDERSDWILYLKVSLIINHNYITLLYHTILDILCITAVLIYYVTFYDYISPYVVFYILCYCFITLYTKLYFYINTL